MLNLVWLICSLINLILLTFFINKLSKKHNIKYKWAFLYSLVAVGFAPVVTLAVLLYNVGGLASDKRL